MSAILEAAAQLLQDASPDRITTAELAKKAGVSVGSMYQYFESKDAVILTLATDTVAKLSDAVRHALDNLDSDDVSLAITPIVDTLLEAHRHRPERIGFLIDHLAINGKIGALDDNFRELEAWLAHYFSTRDYAPPERARIRVRIAVQGVSAVLRATMRESPEDIAYPYLRDELIRFLYGLLHGPSTAP